jgi:hypothetical protein
VTSSMVGREEEQQQESLTGDEDGTGQDAEEERRRARAGEEADTRRNKLKPIKILGPDSHYGTKGNVRRQVTG